LKIPSLLASSLLSQFLILL